MCMRWEREENFCYTINGTVSLDLFLCINVSDVVCKVIIVDKLIGIIGKEILIVIIERILHLVVEIRGGLIEKGLLLEFHVVHHCSDVVVVFFDVRTFA